MKVNSPLTFCLLVFLYSCSGPRNTYSVSPFVSPVPLALKASAVDVSYFAHARDRSRERDSVGGKERGFSLVLSHMLRKKLMVGVFVNAKSERDQFYNSTDVDNNFFENAGFDSSIVLGKRKTVGLSIAYFADQWRKITPSLAATISYHTLKRTESGLLLQQPYARFYNVNQLSTSVQGTILFEVSSRFHIAPMSRLTFLQTFTSSTDYSAQEKVNANIHDNRLDVFLGIIGLYTDYRPLKSVPLTITAQFFNDIVFWNQTYEKYEPNRTYIKGTGVTIGLKYAFGMKRVAS